VPFGLLRKHTKRQGTDTLWSHDRERSQSKEWIVGVDEAGRGCLAGPVFAAAVALPVPFFDEAWEGRNPPVIDDSKKLSLAGRETALGFLRQLEKSGAIRISLGTADVSEIEDLNILGATTLAMRRAINGLRVKDIPRSDVDLPLWRTGENQKGGVEILVDGRPVKNLGYSHHAIIGGDGISLSIAMASVVAKTERDQWMERAHHDYAHYCWNKNRGYGTAEHLEGLRRHGPSPLHRKLFLRKFLG